MTHGGSTCFVAKRMSPSETGCSIGTNLSSARLPTFPMACSRQRYLDRHGRPDFAKQCAGHRVASLCEAPEKVVHIEWLKSIASRAHVVLRTNGIQSHVAVVEKAKRWPCLPRVLGDRRPAFVRIEPSVHKRPRNLSAKSLKMVVDAARIEPVSKANSLLTGKFTGNFAESGPSQQFLCSFNERIQMVTAKFPTQRNREFLQP